jgi:hypothetical protein
MFMAFIATLVVAVLVTLFSGNPSRRAEDSKNQLNGSSVTGSYTQFGGTAVRFIN